MFVKQFYSCTKNILVYFGFTLLLIYPFKSSMIITRYPFASTTYSTSFQNLSFLFTFIVAWFIHNYHTISSWQTLGLPKFFCIYTFKPNLLPRTNLHTITRSLLFYLDQFHLYPNVPNLFRSTQTIHYLSNLFMLHLIFNAKYIVTKKLIKQILETHTIE